MLSAGSQHLAKAASVALKWLMKMVSAGGKYYQRLTAFGLNETNQRQWRES
jgi:hypothetical protein